MSSAENTVNGEVESLEQMQARHRKEQRDLQSRITNKKKNATKKTRKFVNDECAELERQLKERQEEEIRKLTGAGDDDDGEEGEKAALEQQQQQQQQQQDESQQPQQPPPPPSSSSEPAVTNLTNKLNTTTLSPSTQSQPQPQTQQQQPQKQKRNRQKERLARRAAEQEAAAQAAEAEASNMTDRRGLERERMQRELAAHALREHEIAPDGHCLFSAVADQLEVNGIPLLLLREGAGTGIGPGPESGVGRGGVGNGEGEGFDAKTVVEEPYRVVRRAAADWIAGHRDEYAGFLEEGVDEYVGKIRDTAEWGGQLELSALANAYGVEIRVVQGDGRPVEVVTPTSPATGEENGKGEGEGKEKGEKKKKTLWLAYYRHGYGLGEHYNSLRKAKAVQ
ncbi:uncharacterized protein B0T15DRAFT_491637 [Chaetomium strumarium]|uniref:OTU domain-containing protein n=1 Tax=Chaetomium strumarium TaxID=1170767 RepID=A0AAJ0GZP0_9PEZI|nr:hypothetical protein B0T15DRAFT_491637 [Chaetomium strumarium]